MPAPAKPERRSFRRKKTAPSPTNPEGKSSNGGGGGSQSLDTASMGGDSNSSRHEMQHSTSVPGGVMAGKT